MGYEVLSLEKSFEIHTSLLFPLLCLAHAHINSFQAHPFKQEQPQSTVHPATKLKFLKEHSIVSPSALQTSEGFPGLSCL